MLFTSIVRTSAKQRTSVSLEENKNKANRMSDENPTDLSLGVENVSLKPTAVAELAKPVEITKSKILIY